VAITHVADSISPTEGIVPTLNELIGLRQFARRNRVSARSRSPRMAHAASLLRGRGMEYAESRDYVPGDDARHIDWKLSARTGRTHTKTFQTERERLTVIVADRAPSLYFGSRVRFKSVQAARAGAVAAWSALRDGDRLAALCSTQVADRIPPAGGTRGVLRVLDALAHWYAQPPQTTDSLQPALEQAIRLTHPGARVHILADPHSALAVPKSLWSALGMHLEVDVVLLTDPLEQTPPACRLPLLIDHHRLELDLQSKRTRQAWDNLFLQPLHTLCQNLPGQRIRVHVLSTEQSSESWLR